MPKQASQDQTVTLTRAGRHALAFSGLDVQIARERRRQRRWRLVCAGTGRPSSSAPLVGGELVWGPRGAHEGPPLGGPDDAGAAS